MSWLHRKLLKIKLYHLFIEWTKVVVLPGFGKLPLYTVALFFFQEIARESLLNKASSLAYSFMLAIFPGIIFLFTLIPYIKFFVDDFQEQLLEFMQMILPINAYDTIESTLLDIVTNQNSRLLSVGFLMAMIFATNGIHSLMRAFNKSSLVLENRSFVKQRLVALGLAIMMIMALTVGMGIITAASFVINHIRDTLAITNSFWTWLIDLTRWIILLGIYFFTLSILYKYGPASSKTWSFFSPGASLATILAAFTFWGFAFYINHFNTYNKLYGSIGTLIVIMIWLYLNSLIILIGFELNASIALSKQSIKIVKPRRFNSFKTKSDEKEEQIHRR